MFKDKVKAIRGRDSSNNRVIDMGMNDGSDTAYYLHCGCQVIAIEANPELAEAANRMFAREIAEGKLTILNLGIAASERVADFYVASNHQWSSFSQEVASRRGMEVVKTIRVSCVPLSTIVREYGVPNYVKIDIEGYDLFCVESLSQDMAPPYISVEFAHGMEHRLLRRLLELGYVQFKLLNQVTYTDKRPIFDDEFVARVARKLYSMRPLQPVIRRVLPRADFDTYTGRFDWTFAEGASGPFAEQTYGRWITSEEVLRRHAALSKVYKKAGTGFWWDLHARKEKEHETPGLDGPLAITDFDHTQAG